MNIENLKTQKYNEFQNIKNNLRIIQEIIWNLPQTTNGGVEINYTDVSPNKSFADATVSIEVPDRFTAIKILQKFQSVSMLLDSSSEQPFRPNVTGRIDGFEGTEIFPARLIVEPNGNRIYLNWFAFRRELNRFIEINCYLRDEPIQVFINHQETQFQDFPPDARIIRQGEGMYQYYVAFWNLPVEFETIFLKKTTAKCLHF